MPRRLALVALLLVPFSARATGGVCPGNPLACVGSGSQTLVVALGLPPFAPGILVAGPFASPGPSFGSGRWCIADPRVRLATTCADADGTALVRLNGRPSEWGGYAVQLVWRDRLSGRTGSSQPARLPAF